MASHASNKEARAHARVGDLARQLTSDYLHAACVRAAAAKARIHATVAVACLHAAAIADVHAATIARRRNAHCLLVLAASR